MNYAKSVVVSPLGIAVWLLTFVTGVVAFVSVVSYLLTTEANSALAKTLVRLSRWTER